MFFLMNDVVLSLDELAASPRMMARRFRALSFDAVTALGRELYAAQPLLHETSPTQALRLASLIAMKGGGINSALFLAPFADCPPDQVTARYAVTPLGIIADLHARQETSGLDTVLADRQVWRRLAA